eukprot:6383366-Amphidinium_carterae.1
MTCCGRRYQVEHPDPNLKQHVTSELSRTIANRAHKKYQIRFMPQPLCYVTVTSCSWTNICHPMAWASDISFLGVFRSLITSVDRVLLAATGSSDAHERTGARLPLYRKFKAQADATWGL